MGCRPHTVAAGVGENGSRHADVERTCFKAGGQACSVWLKEGGRGRKTVRTIGSRNSCGHFLVDALGRLLRVHPTIGQASGQERTGIPLRCFPWVMVLVANRDSAPARQRTFARSEVKTLLREAVRKF